MSGNFNLSSQFENGSYPLLTLPTSPAQCLFALVDQQTLYCRRPFSSDGALTTFAGTEETETVAAHNVEVLEKFRKVGVKTAFIYTSSGTGVGPDPVGTAMGGPYLLKGKPIDIIFPKLSDSVDTPKGRFVEKTKQLGIQHIFWGGFGTSACYGTSIFDVFNGYGIPCTALRDCTANNLNARLENPILTQEKATSRKIETLNDMVKAGITVTTSDHILNLLKLDINPTPSP